MKYEVIEKATGAKMSRTYIDKIGPTSSTVFNSRDEAAQWARGEKLSSATHEIREAQ